MPLRNRVSPLGEIVATAERGHVYGNRGCIHNASGEIVRRFAVKRWIACQLSFKGWHRDPTPQPGKYTGLFFLDDATAFAAGHRPCAECRRADYVELLSRVPFTRADPLDEQLHRERLGERTRVDVRSLPNGAFVLFDDAPHLVLGETLRPWSFGGYGAPVPARGRLELITPPTIVEALRGGWSGLVPFIALN